VLGRTLTKSSVTGQCGALKTYLYDGHTCVSETVNGVSKTYAVPGGEALWEQAGGTNLVYAKDGRGNVTGLWGGGESGYAARFDYDAFGNVSSRVPAGDSFAKVTNTSGPRYRGELYDSETEQVFLRHRFYDPGVGRFLSMDPKGTVDGPNLYAYCGGDPVNYSDPTGCGRWRIVDGAWTWFDDEGDPDQPPYSDVSIATHRKADWWHWLGGDSSKVVEMVAANENWRRRMEGRPALQKPLGDSALADTIAIVGDRSAQGTGEFVKGTGTVLTGGVPMLLSNTADAIATGDPDQARAILWGGVKNQGTMIVLTGAGNLASTGRTGVAALDNAYFAQPAGGTVAIVDFGNLGKGQKPLLAAPSEAAIINPRLLQRIEAWRSYHSRGGAQTMQDWVSSTQRQYGGVSGGYKSGFLDWLKSIESTHGNSTSSTRPTYLYGLFEKDGTFLKWGVTQDLSKRYSAGFLEMHEIIPYNFGPRRTMLNLERGLVETQPGPLNFEPWAGSKQ